MLNSSGFGARSRACRAAKGLTLAATAQLVGVSVVTVWRWEDEDRPPQDVNVMARLADAYGVSFGWLAVCEGSGSSGPIVVRKKTATKKTIHGRKDRTGRMS